MLYCVCVPSESVTVSLSPLTEYVPFETLVFQAALPDFVYFVILHSVPFENLIAEIA